MIPAGTLPCQGRDRFRNGLCDKFPGLFMPLKIVYNAYMKVITDSESLSLLCGRLENAPHITVDTEFMREKTYWPQLCLVQVADENTIRE